MNKTTDLFKIGGLCLLLGATPTMSVWGNLLPQPDENLQNSTSDQKHQVTGVIIDDEGLPVIGANVLEKGSGTNGTITDAEGSYSLNVASDATLRELLP